MYELKDTILYLDNVSVSYGNNLVLKDINLIEKDVSRVGTTTGQTIAVVGRSGRGKSTLFKVLTGLLAPTTGQALIKDFEAEGNAAKLIAEGDVGFVNQKYTLFRHKTVNQALMYALRKSGLTKQQKQTKINEHLANWGLFEHKDKYPNELSGGQQQRTAILEQIFSSGHLMILDEPFSGLDVGNIESVKESFRLIGSEDDFNTIIFSTHDINLAVELADSIYVIGHPSNDVKYSTIVKNYDLKQMGLAWKEFGAQHLDLVNQIKIDLINS